MSKDNRTLPGGFLRPEHVARNGSDPGNSSTPTPFGEGPSSTPPPDSAKAFDPYRFGAYTVPPSLRMELINIEVPDTPEDQLFHPPPIEEPKTSSPDVEPASDTVARRPLSAPARAPLLPRTRLEVVLGGLAVAAALGVVLLQRSCGEQSSDVATVSAARTSVVGSTPEVGSTPQKPVTEVSVTPASPRVNPASAPAHPLPPASAPATVSASAPSTKPIEPTSPAAQAKKRGGLVATSPTLANTAIPEPAPAAPAVPSPEPPSPPSPTKSQSVFDTKMRPPID